MLSKEQDRIRQQKRRALYAPQDVERVRKSNRQWRKDNPVLAKEITDRYRRSRRDFLQQHKDVPCKDCGGEYPAYVMDFDHRELDEKLFSVSEGYRLSMSRLMAEIAKCDVVCANCHRERTHQQGF